LSAHYQLQSVILEDHPALAGHFPGNPVVPGVVLLEHVAQALTAWQPESSTVGFPAVKFLQVLRPGQLFVIRLQQKEGLIYSFECDSAGQIIASGTLACGTP
jgi:3-hydroxymyristoyl/3-hydroxydecanoyl-(acyl carrier protein) dehydratase